MSVGEDRFLLPVYARQAIEPVSGHGVWLRTRDGREVLDLYGGHAVAALGYGHPRLLQALGAQAESLVFQSNAVELDVRVRAGERLAAFAPDGLDRALLVNSGAEANENALRIAFRATGRTKVVALEGGFHGRTAAAGAATWGSSKWYAFPQAPFAVDFVPVDDEDALARAVDDDTAALIVEPVQGVAGARDLAPAFVERCRALASERGAMLIFDEVQCGVGRVGQPFAAQHYGVTPDILTTAKGLGGGFPTGAVIIGGALAERFGVGDFGTTFGGGPLACAMIAAVLDAIVEEGLLQNVRAQSARIRETCVTGPVDSIQGLGLLLGLRTRRPAGEVARALLEHDILVGGASDPNIVRILAPLVLADEHVDRLATALEAIG